MSSYNKGEKRAEDIWGQATSRIFFAENGWYGDWRMFYKEKLHGLYLLTNLVRRIESRILKLAVHVVRLEEGRQAF